MINASAKQLALLLSLLGAMPAMAAPSANLNRFRPAELATSGFAISGPMTPGHLKFHAQLVLDYAHDPLEVAVTRQAIVAHQVALHGVMALGIGDRFALFTGIPVNLRMDRDSNPGIVPEPDGGTVGDLYFGMRLRLMGEADDAFALAAQLTGQFPVADAAFEDQRFSGDDAASIHPELLAQMRCHDWNFTANAGYRAIADQSGAAPFRVGDAFTYGIGITAPVVDDWKFHLEGYGEVGTEDDLADHVLPFEILMGPKYLHKSGWTAGAAGGGGMSQGYGTPDMRFVASIGYAMLSEAELAAHSDRDNDGVRDTRDQCPDLAEDIDGFEDSDGCPDPDNDGDGIADSLDMAPNHAEDMDGFEDTDGAPDLDNDKDGVPDSQDECPVTAGIKLLLGCPPTDRDGDGVPDHEDKCLEVAGEARYGGCLPPIIIGFDVLQLPEKIMFELDSATLTRRSRYVLNDVVKLLNQHPEISTLIIEGHTDSIGEHDYNVVLSKKRADAVVNYMLSQGIEEGRLRSEGYGPDRLLDPNAKTVEEHSVNRRVVFRIQRSNAQHRPEVPEEE